jgi:mRNA-degrading endonuclease RelE of RelBE toxin-antitoxin system
LARLVFARRALSDLLDLGLPLVGAIEDTLGLLEWEPFAGNALRGRLSGLYSLRVGSYRLLYQLIDEGKTIRVAAIRHRSTSYGSDPR